MVTRAAVRYGPCMQRSDQIVIGLCIGACGLGVVLLGLLGPERTKTPARPPATVSPDSIPKVAVASTGDEVDLAPYVARGRTLVEFGAEW